MRYIVRKQFSERKTNYKTKLDFVVFFPIGINSQYEDVSKHFKQQHHLISKMKKKSELEWCFKFHFWTCTHVLECESLWHVRLLYKNLMLWLSFNQLFLSSGSSQTLYLLRLFLWHHPTVVISIKEKKRPIITINNFCMHTRSRETKCKYFLIPSIISSYRLFYIAELN